MPELLIKLNNCEMDEVEEICQLLEQHHIDYYQTDAGRWGFSVAGIWLRDEQQLAEARALLEEYQQQRQARVRGEYEALRQSGQHDTFLRRLSRQPLLMLLYLLAILAIFYLSMLPFLGMLNPEAK